MVRYLVLFQFTEQGIKHISESASRAEAFQKAAQKAGGTVKWLWFSEDLPAWNLEQTTMIVR